MRVRGSSYVALLDKVLTALMETKSATAKGIAQTATTKTTVILSLTN